MAGGSWAMPNGCATDPQTLNPYQMQAQSVARSQPVAVASPHTASASGFGGAGSAAFGRGSAAPAGMSCNATMQQACPASQLPQLQSGSFFQQPQYSQQTVSQVASHVVPPAQANAPAFASLPALQQQHGSDVPAVGGQLPPCLCGQPCAQFVVKKEGPNQGRLFYKCGKPESERCQYFQWADEPPRQGASAAQTGVVHEGAPSCHCRMPAVAFTVRKEGPNTGREFYTCSKPREQRCGFFHWADEGTPKETPNCPCGVPTKLRTVMKDGPNRGRPFYSCAAPPPGCGLFQWGDEDPQSTETPMPNCTCGVPTKQRTVVKDGPNRGRKFYCCAAPPPGCGLFQWGDEDTQSTLSGHRPVATPARQGSRQGSDVCYKCNQPGHWASSCPNAAMDGFNKGRGKGRGGAHTGRVRDQGSDGFAGFPSEPY